MGTVYKLKPEVIQFILEAKKAKPEASCRSLTAQVSEKFSCKISKSSINKIFKDSGLSAHVGRREKKKRLKMPADLGMQIGTQPPIIVELPQVQPTVEPEIVQTPQPESIALPQPAETEVTPQPEVMAGLTPEPVPEATPEPVPEVIPEQPKEAAVSGTIILRAIDLLFNGPCSNDEINVDFSSCFEQRVIQPEEFSPNITNLLQEARCIKIAFGGKNEIYLDAQMRTLWSTPHIPFDFASPLTRTKQSINKCFGENSPLIIFATPAYDASLAAFLDFLSQVDSLAAKSYNISLYSDKLKLLEEIKFNQENQQFFLFGHFPSQFGHFQKIDLLGEFKSWIFTPLNKEIFLSEASLELVHPVGKHTSVFKGVAIKTGLNERIKLLILSNLYPQQLDLEALTQIYLNNWPNLEEGYADFSRKIELFTYTGELGRYFSAEIANLKKEPITDKSGLFDYYCRALDLYVRWQLLPSEYQNKGFLQAKEQFYALEAILKFVKDSILVSFTPAPNSPQQKNISFLCRRLNEQKITLSDGKKIWFSL